MGTSTKKCQFPEQKYGPQYEIAKFPNKNMGQNMKTWAPQPKGAKFHNKNMGGTVKNTGIMQNSFEKVGGKIKNMGINMGIWARPYYPPPLHGPLQ